ncbi:dTMP kinase [Sphingomonas bacterium]|uniref:dTMP kinase n=1 Tax=Sphingomonas bacterium TaxID=1895847 RepID=UPI001575404B|nr:dTMP kinase [Sphingomonas bacterium]
MPGRFISLEGGEGAGKSTQARALAAALGHRGIEAVVTREPGGSEGAEAIRALVLQGRVDRWGPRAETLMFAAARADHVATLIRPALAAGCWVICDRFLDSTRAYQGAAEGVDDAAILALHDFGSQGLLPDRTFVLDVPVEQGTARAIGRDGAGTDRFAARGAGFHQAVARGFRTIADREPERVRLIDASGDAAAVTTRLLAELSDWLA